MQTKFQPIVVLAGPTAVGKTEIGIELAKQLNTEIISADSMQIYRYLDIGTAKPTLEQRQQVNHYMLDVVNPDEPYNAAMYSQQAEQVAVKLSQQDKMPFVVGGSGLYIRALIDGIFEQPKIDAEWRNKFKLDNKERNSVELYTELRQIDAPAADKIHQNDRRRILRALEVYHCFHIPISQFQLEQREQGTRFQPCFIGIKLEMRELYQRIDLRVDRMLNQGWVDEVKQLREKGYASNLLAMQGLGYRHINAYLDNKIELSQMVYLIKRDTRHYAKRQMTWFRANQRINWFELKGANKSVLITQIMLQIQNYIKKT